MHGGGGGGGKRARIEIIPLIDIIFFLLATFVMVSLSMTKNQGITVPLPSASTSASLGDQAELDKAVTVTLDEKAELFWNKDKITPAQLPMKLQALKTTSKEPKVLINGAAKVPFENVMAILDEVRRAGIAKASFVTE